MFDRYIMSTKYLSNTSLPNEAINIRVNDLIVDGSYSGPAIPPPDPLVVADLTVTSQITYSTRFANLNPVITQLISNTNPVTLNAPMGTIFTFFLTASAAVPNFFTFNNSLILPSTYVRISIIDYSGLPDGTDGFPIVNVYGTGTGSRTICIGNTKSSAIVNHFVTLFFELIQREP